MTWGLLLALRCIIKGGSIKHERGTTLNNLKSILKDADYDSCEVNDDDDDDDDGGLGGCSDKAHQQGKRKPIRIFNFRQPCLDW